MSVRHLASRVALLTNRDNVATAVVVRTTEGIATQMGIQLHVVKVRQPADLDAAFQTIVRAGAHALVVVVDPLFSSQRQRIVELAARHRLPAAYASGVFPEVGASSPTDSLEPSASSGPPRTWTGS